MTVTNDDKKPIARTSASNRMQPTEPEQTAFDAFAAERGTWIQTMAREIATQAWQNHPDETKAWGAMDDIAARRIHRMDLREIHDLVRFADPEAVSEAMELLDPFMDEDEIDDTDGRTLITIIATNTLAHEARAFFDHPDVRPTKATARSKDPGAKRQEMLVLLKMKRRETASLDAQPNRLGDAILAPHTLQVGDDGSAGVYCDQVAEWVQVTEYPPDAPARFCQFCGQRVKRSRKPSPAMRQ